MADYLPQATGNWSTTTWITAVAGLTALAGSPPTVVDDVYADGKTITVNINTAVLSVRTTTSPRTAGLAGGGFTLNNGISLSANVFGGTTAAVTFSLNAPNSASIYGNALGGSTNGTPAILNSGTGTLTVYGNVSASTFNSRAYGASNTSTGTLNVYGNVQGNSSATVTSYGLFAGGTVNIFGNVYGSSTTGGSSFSSGIGAEGTSTINISGSVQGGKVSTNYGIQVTTNTNTINITGSVVGGDITNGHGINNGTNSPINVVGTVLGGLGSTSYGINTSGPTLTVIGDVSGGAGTTAYGINYSGTGTAIVSGTVIGGLNGAGLNNSSTGTVIVTKAVGNGWGLGSVGFLAGAVGLANSQNGKAYVEQVEFGVRGQTPISGPVYILPSNRNTLVGYTTAIGTSVTFYNSLSVTDLLPPVSSVRLGTVYNVGNSTGTMAVPSASAVQFGVAVDNTTGTAALQPQDVWGYARLSATQVNSLGDRLRNVATTQSVGQQIASFNL